MSRKFLTGIDLDGQKATNVADGTSPSDAVNRGQLDALSKGLVWKTPVKAATTTNITLTGAQTIDGVSVVATDRVLVKDQTDAENNGIYVAAAGAWSRATDLDEADEFANGVAVSVGQGSTNGDKSFVLTTDGPVTVGTTELDFGVLGGSGSSYTAGNGLDLSGTTFYVSPKSGGGIDVDGTGVSIDPNFSGLIKRYSANVPDGSTSATITHNLGTTDVLVQVHEVSSGEVVECDVTISSSNVVTLGFASPPASAEFRVVVIG
ncbi:hypothetical protein HMPREF0063_10039 [Aeromicrobium marinum DSM 15272]|uniref:Trimeric autotransporter adhesin YadA-like stalk domain-containing protein n=1 Tax=Aeromicrobium marinum DSM 15272 TaxID=585531 RepID=E2S7N2_9ACTN|nr:hypothetical protein [Aeromicrobium marinum]EFQ84698.1 hypothetical protein HMPREF0063_10039 [Aeromicrobium marinum DSM 15272]